MNIPETDMRCENCLHWLHDHERPRYGKRAGITVVIAQCANEEDPRAPYADMERGESFVFPTAEASCQAFTPHPDINDDPYPDDLAAYSGVVPGLDFPETLGSNT